MMPASLFCRATLKHLRYADSIFSSGVEETFTDAGISSGDSCALFCAGGYPGRSRRGGWLIPAQAATFLCSRRVWALIPAQNVDTEVSARVGQCFPAQAVTIFLPAPEKILHSRAERCHEEIRAG